MNSYDEIPYKSSSFPQTHPDRLATIAHLFGLTPKPVTHCRVLELGCASGGNLIPMAYHLPKSEFIGIDLSARQTQEAQTTITDLQLSNIKIEQASIMDIDGSWGSFDYIICHGVYSWVANEVQDKILSVASENLDLNGIVYVSYNVYPGWHMRDMVRRMMHYHSNQFESSEQRIDQARALINFLASSTSTDSYYGALLQNELNLLQRCNDSYLFHEHLEEHNSPIYFYEFNERAKENNLQYLGESDFFTMINNRLPEEVSQTLEKISPDIIRREQYMDFLRNRFFRQTLLCHNHHALKRDISSEVLKQMLIASPLKPEPELVDFSPNKNQIFRSPNGFTINTDFPLTKAALTILSKNWPSAMHINTLLKEVHSRIKGDYTESIQ
ncbi:MAG: class I SAM-dependent methyltransferase, partial [Gammaproteobacteria bacterium]